MAEDKDRYIVRFPEGMREMIKKSAAENGRSINSDIIQMLKQAYANANKKTTGFEKSVTRMVDDARSCLRRGDPIDVEGSVRRMDRLFQDFMVGQWRPSSGKIIQSNDYSWEDEQ